MQSTTSIIPIRALNDNYIWTILDNAHKKAYVVDPGDAKPVISKLDQLGFNLNGILITHHHADHTAGVNQLIEYAGNIPVIASSLSSVSSVNQTVKDGDTIVVGLLTIKVMEIPGHTLDHLAYYIDSEFVFSGDTLFSAGCGRIFEGTPDMMFTSLNKLLQLNDKTKLYCGHEYTLDNLAFAKTVEANNPDILNKMAHINKMQEPICTLPSNLAEEKKINPFLRTSISSVMRNTEIHAGKKLSTPLAIFTHLREWKNNWKNT